MLFLNPRKAQKTNKFSDVHIPLRGWNERANFQQNPAESGCSLATETSLSLGKGLVFQVCVASAVLFIDHRGTFWKQLLQCHFLAKEARKSFFSVLEHWSMLSNASWGWALCPLDLLQCLLCEKETVHRRRNFLESVTLPYPVWLFSRHFL